MRNGRCRLHGGAALVGTAHPRFKHGRYSRYVPSNLLDDFEAVLADPEYLSCRDQIAASVAREHELLRKLSDLELTADIAGRARRLKKALAQGGIESVLKRASSIENAAAEQAESDALWRELRTQQDHTRKLREAESRLKTELGQRLDKDRAAALLMWVVRLLKERLGEESEVLKGISREIRARLADRRDRAAPVSGNGRL